jgi:hypothetical protein
MGYIVSLKHLVMPSLMLFQYPIDVIVLVWTELFSESVIVVT